MSNIAKFTSIKPAPSRTAPQSERVPVKAVLKSFRVNVTTLGGTGGVSFLPQSVASLSIRGGDFVDQLTINGESHGGSGGQPSQVLKLPQGEFINRIEINAGEFVDRLAFTTNKGHSVEGGGPGGQLTVLQNIRLLAISGKAGELVDQLTFIYLESDK